MNSYYKQKFFLKRVQVKAKDFIKQKKRNQTDKAKESKEKSTLQRMPL